GEPWDDADRLKFVRLLGKEPIEAIKSPDLNAVFLAWDAIEEGSGRAYWERCRGQAEAAGNFLAPWMRWREIKVKKAEDRLGAGGPAWARSPTGRSTGWRR